MQDSPARTFHDLLWSQWHAVGVQTAGEPYRGLIDPDALFVYSVVMGRRAGEARLHAAALAWGDRHRELLVTARIKQMVRTFEPDDRMAVLDLLAVIDGSSASAADAALRSAHESIAIRLPSLPSRPDLFRLRCRALFGPNARAEAIAYLTCVGEQGSDLAHMSAATGFAKRHLSDHVAQLEAGGAITTWRVKNRSYHRVDPSTSEYLLSGADTPAWIHWTELFGVALGCIDAFSLVDGSGGAAAAAATMWQFESQLHMRGLPSVPVLDLRAAAGDSATAMRRWCVRVVDDIAREPS